MGVSSDLLSNPNGVDEVRVVEQEELSVDWWRFTLDRVFDMGEMMKNTKHPLEIPVVVADLLAYPPVSLGMLTSAIGYIGCQVEPLTGDNGVWGYYIFRSRPNHTIDGVYVLEHEPNATNPLTDLSPTIPIVWRHCRDNMLSIPIIRDHTHVTTLVNSQ